MGLFSKKTSSKKEENPKQEEEIFTPESQETKAPVKKTTSTKKASPKAKSSATSKKSTKTAKPDKKEETVSAVKSKRGQAGESYRLLKSPLISEKAALLAAKNVYVFNVPVSAEKIAIAKAVKALYNVDVIKVRTARGIGKVVSRGRVQGRRNRWKKAFVTIKKDQKIDLYEGV